jgi:hypothetical protein
MGRNSALFAAVFGVVALFGLSALLQPPDVALRDVWKHDGEHIRVEGTVCNKKGDVIVISDGDARLNIYFDGQQPVFYGDLVRAEGDVGDYAATYALYADTLEVIERFDERNISVAYLAENYAEFARTDVNVTGYVSEVRKDSFTLTDARLEYRLTVYCNETVPPPCPGRPFERVCVKARFEYRPSTASFCLVACEPHHGVIVYG